MSTKQSTIKTSPIDSKAKTDWRAIVFDWQASGLSVSEFCRQHQVPEHQIHYYRRKFLTQPNSLPTSSPTSTSPSSGFAEVAVPPLSASELTLRLPNGMELSGLSSQSPAILAAVIKALL